MFKVRFSAEAEEKEERREKRRGASSVRKRLIAEPLEKEREK